MLVLAHSQPDYALALHDSSELETGKIAYTPVTRSPVPLPSMSPSAAAAPTARAPRSAKDPIVLAAEFIMAIPNDCQVAKIRPSIPPS